MNLDDFIACVCRVMMMNGKVIFKMFILELLRGFLFLY